MVDLQSDHCLKAMGHMQVVPLLQGRERRPNAGSRMQSLLAEETEVDQLFAEEASDADFESKKEEKDIFDSDFGNTSSGSSEERSEDEDDAIAAEEAADRKAARRGRLIPTGSKTFKEHGDRSEIFRISKRRRLSPGGTSFIGGGTLGERASARSSTQAFKQNIDERLEAEEARRLEQIGRLRAKQSFAPRRRSITQAELIAEALETEELNQASLLAFYAAEEERRDAQNSSGRSHRTIGPTLSFISSTSEPPLEKPAESSGNSVAPLRRHYARNYILLRDMDVSSFHVKGAVLGYHTDWSANTSAPSPRGRSRFICAVTGDPARYRDPSTGAPYASIPAYSVLRGLYRHVPTFNDALQCFTGTSITPAHASPLS